MGERYDAIIIGAGIIGAATAFELCKRGWKTLNIDFLPASGYGSTSNSCAIIRVHYSTLEGTAFAYEGYHYWRDWADYLEVEDERGYSVFHETGALVMKTESNDYLRKHAELAEQLDIPHEHWGPKEILAKLPIYNLKRYGPPKPLNAEGFGESVGGEVEGGLYFPTAGYINDPQLATHNLQRATEAKGGAFLFNKRVVEILRENGRTAGVVLDDGQRIEAPVVVNVAGPHSYKVNELADILDDMTITTKALRQEVVHVPAPKGFDFEHHGLVVSDSDIGCYNRPEQGNHILVGSEDPECDPREFVDPDEFYRDFTNQWTVQAYRMGQRISELGIPNQRRGVVDLYDVTEDWIPIYDRSNLPGYYMAIGSSGNQFKNAPIAGAMMAELIIACENGHDHDKEPLQFALPYLKRSIDVGFYSRKREINPESSFSVLG